MRVLDMKRHTISLRNKLGHLDRTPLGMFLPNAHFSSADTFAKRTRLVRRYQKIKVRPDKSQYAASL
jgi:hypothetical protein